MLVKVLMIAAVVALPVPALILGGRGLTRRPGLSTEQPADRLSFALLVALRLLVLLAVLELSLVSLVSLVGALIRHRDMPALVSVFFFADLLLGAFVLLSFGRRDRRSSRRRANPAAH